MISNPTSVLKELEKYQRIINLAKTALEREAKGLLVDDLRDILKVRLDECGFTQAVGLTAATVPLHSVTAYLDKPDTLRKQIAEAGRFVESVIEKIKADVGPFYSKVEVMAFKELSELTLGDQVWLPTMEEIKVKRYMDSAAKIVIDADWAHGNYRTAKDGENFGPWKFFTK